MPSTKGQQWGRTGGHELLNHNSPALLAAGSASLAALPRCLAASRQPQTSPPCTRPCSQAWQTRSPQATPRQLQCPQHAGAEQGPEGTALAEEWLRSITGCSQKGQAQECSLPRHWSALHPTCQPLSRAQLVQAPPAPGTLWWAGWHRKALGRCCRQHLGFELPQSSQEQSHTPSIVQPLGAFSDNSQGHPVPHKHAWHKPVVRGGWALCLSHCCCPLHASLCV